MSSRVLRVVVPVACATAFMLASTVEAKRFMVADTTQSPQAIVPHDTDAETLVRQLSNGEKDAIIEEAVEMAEQMAPALEGILGMAQAIEENMTDEERQQLNSYFTNLFGTMNEIIANKMGAGMNMDHITNAMLANIMQAGGDGGESHSTVEIEEIFPDEKGHVHDIQKMEKNDNGHKETTTMETVDGKLVSKEHTDTDNASRVEN